MIKKLIVCKFNEGFPDLTVGKVYEVVRETENAYTIIDDDNDTWEYFKVLFEVIIDR